MTDQEIEKCPNCEKDFYANGDIQVIQFTGYNKGYVDFNYCKACNKMYFNKADVEELQIQVDRTLEFIRKYDGDVKKYLENFFNN